MLRHDFWLRGWLGQNETQHECKTHHLPSFMRQWLIPMYTKKWIKVQNKQIKCEWHTCESLFTLQSIPASCLSSPSGQGPLNLHAVKRIHTNTHPQCVQSSRHTHTHIHTTFQGEIHLFSHCALRLLSCPAKRGKGGDKLLGISGLLSQQHSLQAKAVQLTVKPSSA